MAAIVANDTLGLTGRAGGVQDIKRIGGCHRDTVGRLRAGDGSAPIDIALRGQFAFKRGALQDDAPLRLGLGHLDGAVQKSFVSDDALGFDAARGRYDDFGFGIVDARGQFIGGKSAEHDRMNGTNARARQHGDRRFGDHWHVDDDPVALGDAQRLQCAGKQGCFIPQLAVGVSFDRLCDGAVVN